MNQIETQFPVEFLAETNPRKAGLMAATILDGNKIAGELRHRRREVRHVGFCSQAEDSFVVRTMARSRR